MTTTIPSKASGLSFRDPAGHVFIDSGRVKRGVTGWGAKAYEKLIASDLYTTLEKEKKLVAHEDSEDTSGRFYKVLIPEVIPVISYPYEWCFSELKDAALLTLDIQRSALERGMSLKDATPFNVQFLKGRPIFIDTLSFEEYREIPWVAYKQFCEMFLAPLALMAKVSADFNKYLAVDLDGFDLSFASRSLPRGSWFDPGLLIHIHLHALSQSRYATNAEPEKKRKLAGLKLSKTALISMLENLRGVVTGLRPRQSRTTFGDYYEEQGHYSRQSEEFKTVNVEAWGHEAHPASVLDLGGNTGRYARLFTKHGIPTVCVDSDPFCVEENYRLARMEDDLHMLPLRIDLANMPAGLGWASRERQSFFERCRPDLVLALALIHHLRISANVPLALLADFFAGFSPYLLIEFVPKEDIKVQALLALREDTFPDYDVTSFENIFSSSFQILKKAPVPGTARTLYLMKRCGA